jgi:hypothetical protein
MCVEKDLLIVNYSLNAFATWDHAEDRWKCRGIYADKNRFPGGFYGALRDFSAALAHFPRVVVLLNWGTDLQEPEVRKCMGHYSGLIADELNAMGITTLDWGRIVQHIPHSLDTIHLRHTVQWNAQAERLLQTLVAFAGTHPPYPQIIRKVLKKCGYTTFWGPWPHVTENTEGESMPAWCRDGLTREIPPGFCSAKKLAEATPVEATAVLFTAEVGDPVLSVSIATAGYASPRPLGG